LDSRVKETLTLKCDYCDKQVTILNRDGDKWQCRECKYKSADKTI